jgi:flagellar export protein FliJ
MTMADPRFQLATLLRLRESTRDECRARLAEAQRTDQELLDQLTRLGIEQQHVQEECRKAAGPGDVALDRLVEAHRYAVSLRTREEELKQRRQTLAAEIQRRRQALLKADQDVQILEKLRDRRLERHRVEEGRKEAKQIDEAALQAAVT